MSVTYINIYSKDAWCNGCHVDSPHSSQGYEVTKFWVRHEMHINGHWHRPPVGIRAQDCSHYWRLSRYDSDLMVLERRK